MTRRVTEADITRLALLLGRACMRRGMRLAAAESCTGGGVAEAITRIPGSSRWFERGFVTYSNEAKQQMLGVSALAIELHGAVSAEVASQMALGALEHSAADASVAITGVAGPGGGTQAKPVGLVWFAWAHRHGKAQARAMRLPGDREAVRRQSVAVALQGLVDLLG